MDKQVALAKSLLESKGYTVTKVTNESIGAKNISLDLINTALMNQNTEVFATLDIAIIDLYKGNIELI